MARVWMTNRSGLHSHSGGEILGGSEGPYRSLNLGSKVGDKKSTVESNRVELAQVLGLKKIRFMDQVHSALSELVTDANAPESSVDAIILKRSEMSHSMAVAVQVADCVPVVVESEDAVMAIHIGREGLLKGITENSIEQFLDVTRGSQSRALVGPSICGRCYPLSGDLYRKVVESYPATKFDEQENKVDVASGVISVLEQKGLTWEWFGGERECVSCDENYFSYRREVTTGRQAMVIALPH